MGALAAALVDRGAQAIIAGCTEIPLVLEQTALAVPLISSTDVLAARTVAIARGETALPE
jgi:aspartate racemase